MNFESISVIIPCYRSVDTLSRALDAVLCQTLLPSEIILVDDFSNDGDRSRKMIQEKVNEVNAIASSSLDCIAVFLHKNVGPGSARNVGWDLAKGDFIAFLDSDDSWHSNKLEIQCSWLKSNPDISICATGTKFYRADEIALEKINDNDVLEITFNSMLFRNEMPTRSVVLRNCSQYRFSNKMRYSEDYALWLEILSDGARACRINSPLAYHFREEYSPGGVSADLWRMEISELFIYRDFLLEKKISFVQFLVVCLFSFMKFLRRFTMKYLFCLFNFLKSLVVR